MDVTRIRSDFPILQKEIKGKPIIYMDSACMSLKPKQVIDAMLEYYEEFPACAGRSIHKLSHWVEESRRNARDEMKQFIGAKKSEEVVFTRNTTEGMNLVLNSFPLGPGDKILTTDREHNSSLVPSQLIAKRKGAEHHVVLSNSDYTFNMDNFLGAMTPDVKLISFVYSSNLDGYTLPVNEIIGAAHDNDTMVLLDAAQTAPHHKLDVRKLDVDFLALSGHKMLGPTGTGVLYVKEEHYDVLEPFMVGGDTVDWSTYDNHKFLDPPERFEAGLQNYASELGLAAAAKYLRKIGLDKIERHEQKLNRIVNDGFSEIENMHFVGVKNPDQRGGITAFNLGRLNCHDVAMIMNRNYGVMVRSGQHCVHSWFAARGIEGSVRSSLYLYNTGEEAAVLVEAAKEIAKLH
ncbi:MAG: aminotransferase class V-fold PLP-dependent enzyme [Candidatus Thorarchaeota archaeon]|nr:MAG: aminotransferase class V-fold PLP-dependent enzyme [Candidatus Thorarchaeota archaeon]